MNGLTIPTLETERLRLRAFGTSDIDDYAALNADPEVARYLGGGGPWDRGRSWRHLAFLLGHWQLGGSGMWAIEQKETGAFVGMVGFAHPEGWAGFELAWSLVRRWWGRGYATEGAQKALAYAFTVLNKDRVISLIHPENHASIRVAERLGESLRGRTDMMGHDRLVYGIDRDCYTGQIANRADFAGSDGCAGLEFADAGRTSEICLADRKSARPDRDLNGATGTLLSYPAI